MSLKDILHPQNLYYASIYGKNPQLINNKQGDIKKSFEPYMKY